MSTTIVADKVLLNPLPPCYLMVSVSYIVWPRQRSFSQLQHVSVFFCAGLFSYRELCSYVDWRAGSDQLSADDRNNSALSENHGVWQRTFKNCKHSFSFLYPCIHCIIVSSQLSVSVLQWRI